MQHKPIFFFFNIYIISSEKADTLDAKIVTMLTHLILSDDNYVHTLNPHMCKNIE